MGAAITFSTFAGCVEFGDLLAKTRELIARYRPDRLLIEDAASGQSLIQQIADLCSETGVMPMRIRPEGDKVLRFELQANKIKAGQVVLPHTGPWVLDFLNEATRFPGVRHDDQADALAQLLANPPVQLPKMPRRSSWMPPNHGRTRTTALTPTHGQADDGTIVLEADVPCRVGCACSAEYFVECHLLMSASDRIHEKELVPTSKALGGEQLGRRHVEKVAAEIFSNNAAVGQLTSHMVRQSRLSARVCSSSRSKGSAEWTASNAACSRVMRRLAKATTSASRSARDGA